MKIPIQIGQTFNRLTVLSYASTDKHGCHNWNCRCQCGKEVTVKSTRLRSGDTKSCGCIRGVAKTTHGHTWKGGATPEYDAWKSLRARCKNPKTRSYHLYGGRGITVCERWDNSFEAFLEDMGTKPSPEHSLDRINTNGNYEPSNCRWATNEEQRANKRKGAHVYATINGRRMPLYKWVKEFGLPKDLPYCRLRYGWTPEQAVLTPVTTKRPIKDGKYIPVPKPG